MNFLTKIYEYSHLFISEHLQSRQRNLSAIVGKKNKTKLGVAEFGLVKSLNFLVIVDQAMQRSDYRM